MEELKKDKLMIFTFASLALSLVSALGYMIYTLFSKSSITTIIGVLILLVFSIILVLAGFFIENRKAKTFTAVAAIILALYCIFQTITGIINPNDYVIDFKDMDIKEVIEWADKRKININQEFMYSDKFEEFHVIKQDIEKGTQVRKVKEITVTVSNGSNPNKNVDVTNMVGWKLDDVIKYVEDNHLTNVTINFEYNNSIPKDTIISQDIIREIKRNEPVTLVSSLGKELDVKSVTLKDLVGMDLFHATTYLGRNGIKYSILYEFSKDKTDTVIKQSLKKWTVIGPERNEEVILTIAKENEVTVPDLTKMSKTEINTWANNNRIKVEFKEEFDDTVKKDRVISHDTVVGKNIEVGTIIKITISKGQLYMISFTDIDSFRSWANENEIVYDVSYQYSETIEKGKLISISHNKGQIIKNNDKVTLVISEGFKTTIPNLIDLTKEEAEKKCNESKIKCTFTYQDNNIDYTKVTKQSMKSDSTVPNGTSITVTIGK